MFSNRVILTDVVIELLDCKTCPHKIHLVVGYSIPQRMRYTASDTFAKCNMFKEVRACEILSLPPISIVLQKIYMNGFICLTYTIFREFERTRSRIVDKCKMSCYNSIIQTASKFIKEIKHGA